MKSTTTILLLLFISFLTNGFSQTYGNEWIDYNQSYYSFKIVNDGLYRIDYNTLSSAGIPLGTFTPENIQLFGKEQEVPIHLVDGGDNSFDPGDYFIFYAERNDSWLDSSLYLDSSTIGSPGISLYNDTLQYFFTWNSGNNNLRYAIETDTDFSSYTSSNYILRYSEKNLTSEYNEGEKESDASSSFFVPGEGWGESKSNGVPGGYTGTKPILTQNPYTGADAPNAIFHALVSSASNAISGIYDNHHLRWRLGSTGATLQDTTWKGYKQIQCTQEISPTALTNGNSIFYFDIIDDLGVATDYQQLTYYSIAYPATPYFSGANTFSFQVENNLLESKIRLDLSAVTYSVPIMIVHGDTPRMVPLQSNGSFHSTLIPNSANSTNQFVFFADSSLISDVSTLTPVNETGSFTDFLSIPSGIDSALLMIYHEKLQVASTNYAIYRESPSGGNYNTILANVEELYQQFGGGIEKHINGIRRFAHFIYNNSAQKPAGLFLMGKGLREATTNFVGNDGPGTRFDPSRFHQSLLPSFGHPSSDICITSNLEGPLKWTPLISTGRISARTNDELQVYLDKVIEYEAAQDPSSIYNSAEKDWQKQVIHFTGGSDLADQLSFQSIMNNLENKITDSLVGANVTRLYKTSSNPLDPAILNSITDRISNGVSLISYLGHFVTSSSGFEINLDNPTYWNNQGKYPLMLVNSCYNGNIFQLSNSSSEDFVQAPNSGAIGYISSVYIGFLGDLYQYSSEFYDQLGIHNYGKSLGYQMQETIRKLETAGSSSLNRESTCTQVLLNGDPMISLNTHENPEIEITPSSVYFTPSELDLTVDSIEMHIALTNLGHSITSEFSLEVVRNFPSSSVDSVYIFVIDGLHYKDTFSFKMPLQPNIGVGFNEFTISVDLPTVIPEQYDELGNNTLTTTLFINVDGIAPVVPYDFAVVPDDSVTVKASTINPIADYNTYLFELDTTDTFDSPEFRHTTISGYGGVKEVNPSEWLNSSNMPFPLVCEDSGVYFWRVAVDDPAPVWTEFSFQRINGKKGWGQDHFFQFKKNDFLGIDYERPLRQRAFLDPITRKMSCFVYNQANSSSQYNDTRWEINNEIQEYSPCTTVIPQIQVAVVDPNTLTAWATFHPDNPEGHSLGNANDNAQGCRPWRPEKYFVFTENNASQLAAFQAAVTDSIPDGHFLLIYTPISTRYDLWDALAPSMYGTMTALGATGFSPTNPSNVDNNSFIFMVKKGDPSTAVEVHSTYPQELITADFHMASAIRQGFETTKLIGPSSDWGNVYWKQDPQEIGTSDTTVLTIRALNSQGVSQFSIDTAFTLNDSIINLNPLIDAAQYPYIQLSAFYKDSTNFTPAQIDRWHVLYQPLPEAAIDGSSQYTWSLSSDTIIEGQSFDFAVDVKNIYDIDMDSILVKYWVEDANHGIHPILYARQDSLRVDDVLRDTITVSSIGLDGINSLWMEVNPYVNGSLLVTDQPEQEHFNNILQVPFFVDADNENPILDVTFNGTHILNGDIIDPSSEILITLKDDNEFLIMDDISDTTLFGIYLTNPSGVQKRIPFVDNSGNTVMQWIPANSSNKRFKIIWPSEFEEDGVYTLLVQGADRSGNISGDIDYRVTFEIIHESSITNMMNYPNPFSTSTRFVFTLTGSEVPDEILIQILTVTGKVVREITEDQLGTINIGRNITEYAWDGTDEFGDPLANGVYLYKVQTQINGESIKHRDSGADSYFKKEFGKMYLMR
ncbi:MAG: C25 family cysteine peptidase [Crocinitomicaceae bacterium]|nr:C25 family cysteine peptidase [Crocinitomicaceae bacterium]